MDGATVVITGAGSGIGRSDSLRCCSPGAHELVLLAYSTEVGMASRDRTIGLGTGPGHAGSRVDVIR